MLHSWLTDAAEIRPAGAKGVGVFAATDIAGGSIVAGFGGFVMPRPQFEHLPVDQQIHSLQIGDDLFMTCPSDTEPADLFNHSCEPNCGILGSILLMTLRPVAADEELSFDYAMCDADDYDEFACECGAATCRQKVTGNDWMLPELQDRYRGFFSIYLERRIIALRSQPDRDLL